MSPQGEAAEAEAWEPSWQDSARLLLACFEEADRRGISIAVAIADRWGRPVAFQRQPNTTPTSAKIAIAKAFTAANFNTSVGQMADEIPRVDQEELCRHNPQLVFLRGGLPIRRDGKRLGGLGISGAPPEVDDEVAHTALVGLGFDDTLDRP